MNRVPKSGKIHVQDSDFSGFFCMLPSLVVKPW